MATKSSSRHIDAVDRLAADLQQARLHTRRIRRHHSLMVAAGNVPAVKAAASRLQTAMAWEARVQGRWERAAVMDKAWWLRGPAAVPGADRGSIASPVFGDRRAA